PASPDKYNILSAHPNPFNLQTTISFTLPIASQVSLTVHNDLGQSVATLVNGMSLSGKNEIVWDAKGISAGTYFIRLGDGNGIVGGQRIVLQK
ncbi:MAG: T9SS type A sorting domain-containing protein, partial [Calditrichaeota bacterium]|nr:T9SS type A sorting domain-containing protein [Calditrichota bacterium]